MSKYVIAYKTVGSLLPAQWKKIDSYYYWEYEQAKQIFEEYKEGLEPIINAKGECIMPYQYVSETEFIYNDILYTLLKIN